MDNARLLPVAIANLRTSQGFLDKLVSICDQVAVEAAGKHQADAQTVQAIKLLARMTDAVLLQVEHCQRHGGNFSAHQVLSAVVNASAPPKDDGAEVQRMRVIMDLCLQQGDVYRRRSFFQGEELNRLRAVVKAAHAELVATRTVLSK